jgi:hypothetical protein
VKTTRTKFQGALGLAMLSALSSIQIPAKADPPPPTLAPPAPATAPPPVSGVSRRTVALGAAGVAAVGAVSAVVFGVLALQNKSDYEKTPTYSNTDNGNNFAAYTDGCIALAVAAGITSLVLYFTSPPPVDAVVAPSKKAPLLSAPLVTMHGGGAGAVLRF